MTGEHPIVSDRTAFSWPVMVAVVGLAFGGGSAHWRIGALEGEVKTKTEELFRVVGSLSEARHVGELRTQRVEDSLSGIQRELGSMNRKLDIALEGNTRPARVIR